MAAPPEKTLKNMTGEWAVASKLSEGFDEFLAMQGLPWWKRQVNPRKLPSQVIDISH